MSCVEFYIALGTLFCSLAALVVAYISLRISKQVAVLNSHNFTPRFNVKFDDDGVIVKNNDANIFDIKRIKVVVVHHMGYYVKDSYTSVDIPLIVHSRCFGGDYDCDDVPYWKKLIYKLTKKLYYKDGGFEYIVSSISPIKIKEVEDILQKEYQNTKDEHCRGYASPSLYYREEFISIDYQSEYTEKRCYNLRHTNDNHGSEEHYEILTSEEFNQTLQGLEIPKELSAQEIIEYCAKNRVIR